MKIDRLYFIGVILMLDYFVIWGKMGRVYLIKGKQVEKC